jgi:hypothetical protein
MKTEIDFKHVNKVNRRLADDSRERRNFSRAIRGQPPNASGTPSAAPTRLPDDYFISAHFNNRLAPAHEGRLQKAWRQVPCKVREGADRILEGPAIAQQGASSATACST